MKSKSLLDSHDLDHTIVIASKPNFLAKMIVNPDDIEDIDDLRGDIKYAVGPYAELSVLILEHLQGKLNKPVHNTLAAQGPSLKNTPLTQKIEIFSKQMFNVRNISHQNSFIQALNGIFKTYRLQNFDAQKVKNTLETIIPLLKSNNSEIRNQKIKDIMPDSLLPRFKKALAAEIEIKQQRENGASR